MKGICIPRNMNPKHQHSGIAVTAAVILLAGVLHCPIYAQRAGTDRVTEDFDSTLVSNVRDLSGKAVRHNVISAGQRDSILSFIDNSMPKDSPQLRIDILKRILSRIDEEYDRTIPSGNINSAIPKELIMSLIPTSLPVPETFVDKNREKLSAQIMAITSVKTDIAKSIAASTPFNLPLGVIYFGRLLFGLGMPVSGNAIPVMNGLFYIYMPGGKPLEFDESVFKDREHFDPNVYKFSKPQMQYDLHEGLHFKANNLP